MVTRAHLDWQVPGVIGVPDPDIAAMFHDAFFSSRLNAQGVEGAGGRGHLLAGFDLHRHFNSAHGVGDGKRKAPAHHQLLGRSVKDRRH
jgi:hypothetical protein